MPFEQAAAQVSAAGAITIGKRQAEELAVGAVADFEEFYAARRPGPCPAGTGLLITADGSAFPVLPGALRPATAKAARARTQAAMASGWPDDPGEPRKSKKRSAELAAVADIPPAPRTPSDIITALFGTPASTGRRAGDGDAPPARHGPKALRSADSPTSPSPCSAPCTGMCCGCMRASRLRAAGRSFELASIGIDSWGVDYGLLDGAWREPGPLPRRARPRR